ncbi:MAG: peptide chain release factor N(5)-glutamine methyltransferase [Spirochaetes bacterium]|nr:peptide chain release factor N(5)-glutamine methyltransferase [Spirochaetota bacterium]
MNTGIRSKEAAPCRKKPGRGTVDGPVDGPADVYRLVTESVPKLSLTDVYCLLGHATKRRREFLLTHPEYVLKKEELYLWEEYKKRRIQAEPCAYITGKKEFYSLVFEVNGHTLIPRPETELLVDEVIGLSPSSVLDVGTGCGNIAVAVKSRLKECEVFATDKSRRALETAEKNARRILGAGAVTFIHSSFYQAVGERLFDVIVSNPPYVKRRDIASLAGEIKEYEPHDALDGGEDGLDAYRSILGDGGRFLAQSGRIVLEIDGRLLDGIGFLARENGYFIEKTKKDLAGKVRMAVVRKAL